MRQSIKTKRAGSVARLVLSAALALGWSQSGWAQAGAWETVGNEFSEGDASVLSLELDTSGNPYVAYLDRKNDDKATVKKFNGSTWETVGNAGFSAGSVYHLAFALGADNTPYVSYDDPEYGNKVTVKKFNGSAWVSVGNGGIGESSGYTSSVALGADGMPYVAYAVGSGSDRSAVVKKFNGTVWKDVGSPNFINGDFYLLSMKTDGSGTPYVVYSDRSKAMVKKFNGNTWVNVGSAGASTDRPSVPSLAFDAVGTPFVVYQGGSKVKVRKFNGSAWTDVGNTGLTAYAQGYAPALAVDGNGTPYVFNIDEAAEYQSVVKKFDGTAWVNVSKAGFVPGSTAGNTAITVGKDGVPYVAYNYSAYNAKGSSAVMRLKSGAVVSTAPVAPSTTLDNTAAALSNDGKVYVWGYRGSGLQGNGVMNTASKALAAKVQSLQNIVDINGGDDHLIALSSNGDVYGWGNSRNGETGCPGISIATPCKVLGNVKQIAAGSTFSMALDKNGTVWNWGNNSHGQLGSGNLLSRSAPVAIDLKGEKARLIGAAHQSAFAVTEQGHVWVWGSNKMANLGLDPKLTYSVIPMPVRSPALEAYAAKMIKISGGDGWAEALLSSKEVIGWGQQTVLGVGVNDRKAYKPSPVVILRDVEQLHARYNGSLALTTTGKLYTWGRGLLPHAALYSATPMLRNAAATPVKQIGGSKEGLFYVANGELYGVGKNNTYVLNPNSCCGTVNWPGVKLDLSN